MILAQSNEYVSQFTPRTIGASSRASVKIEGNYYTFEASMTKELTGNEEVDMIQEWKMLWDELNAEVDNQIIETEQLYKSVQK